MSELEVNSHPPSKTETYYRIKIRGVLDATWSRYFGNLAMSSEGDETTLFGLVIDQAALHGLLNRIRDLGLHILLVEQCDAL